MFRNQHGRYEEMARTVVQAALLAAQRTQAAGQAYIVTDGQAYSTRQMYEWICESLQRRVPKRVLPSGVLRLLAKVGDAIGRVRGRRCIRIAGSMCRENARVRFAA